MPFLIRVLPEEPNRISLIPLGRRSRRNRQSPRIQVRILAGSTSANKRIDDTHANVHEIGTISRGDRQTMDQRSRRDEAVLDRHGFPGCSKTRQQFRPFQPRVRVPGKTLETPGPCVEPAFQGSRFLPLGRMRILNRSSPRMTGSTAISRSCARSHDTTRGSGVGFAGSLRTLASTRYFTARHTSPRIGLTANRSTQSRFGTKHSFSGQSSSQSTTPWFGRSRTPDQAIVAAFDALHAELLPRFDIGSSAGRTIWPLEETVVLTQGR